MISTYCTESHCASLTGTCRVTRHICLIKVRMFNSLRPRIGLMVQCLYPIWFGSGFASLQTWGVRSAARQLLLYYLHTDSRLVLPQGRSSLLPAFAVLSIRARCPPSSGIYSNNSFFVNLPSLHDCYKGGWRIYIVIYVSGTRKSQWE